MEFPIDFWFKMAWNPSQFNPSNLMEYTENFCRQQFGEKCAKEAARILNLQCKYAHRRTPEQLDARTFDLMSGEWKEYVDQYDQLEREATILRELMPVQNRNAYNELIYHPVRVFCNLYNMYYAVAMNNYYAQQNNIRANEWADKVELCFRRAAELCDEYNHKIAGGKWNHMMDEIYIGYRSWNNPRQNTMPQVKRVEAADAVEGFNLVTVPKKYVAIIEADEFVNKKDAKEAKWQVVPDLGIWKAGVALFPYTKSTEGSSIDYAFQVQEAKDGAQATIILATNFPFNDGRGQRMTVMLDGKEVQTMNVNEASRYVVQMSHDQNFEWETTRMNKQRVSLPALTQGKHQLSICPLDPGIVIERIVVE